MSEEPVDAVKGGSAPSKQAGRFTVPDFLMDLGREPGALAALVAGGLALFGAAYGAGLAVAIAFMGGVTVVGSVIAWLGMGRSDAVVSVWEHRDERGPATDPGAMPVA